MSRSYRILHCLRAPIGGLFRHVCDLAAAQAERGHSVGILADSSLEDRLTQARFSTLAPKLALGITRIPIHRLPGLADLAAVRATYDLARRTGADVLHGHGAKGGAYARLASRVLRAKGARVSSFYTPHGGSLHYRPGTPAGVVLLGLERVLGRFTDGLIFECAYAARTYRERVGAGGTPFRVIHNGLRPEDFAPHRPDPGAAPFLFIGELRQIKGVDVLLEALALLGGGKDVGAIIVGAGPDAERLGQKARDLGLRGRVRFSGALPAREALALGRCLVVPSRAESFPYVVLEASAAGMPLIATCVGGIPEIVEGTNVPLIPAGDARALAAAMRAFLADEGAARAEGIRLRDAVARRFTVSAMADAVLEFYGTAGLPDVPSPH